MTKIDFSKIQIQDLACLISEILQQSSIRAILVGGACVSIYSQNQYQSFDLDFVAYEELKVIERALTPLGFKRTGRCFAHPQCPYIIDFLNPPISIGHEAINQFKKLKTSIGSLRLLTATDCVKDRLASYFHWNDAQALEQALLVAACQKIELHNLKLWAKKEGHLEKLKLFLKHLEIFKKKHRPKG